ncbi:hypothetical protein C8Q79DRAFT_200325 [Trametes meyenii]|nr:hypothetical protein C8Q79DRAFT_200325 [Trametes meyenii]
MELNMGQDLSSHNDLNLVQLAKLLTMKVYACGDYTTVEILKRTLEEVQRASLVLCGKINDCAPIHRIPHEILVKIFAEARQVVPELSTRERGKNNALETACGPYTIRNTWNLCPVAEVCAKWRTVVIGTPSLWSSVFLGTTGISSPYIPDSTFFLPRCESGPVDVYTTENLSRPQFLQQLGRPYPLDSILEQYGSRIRELHFRLENPTRDWRIPGILLSPLLSPRRLVVGLHPKPIQRWIGFQSIFGGQSLKLESLALLRCSFLPSNPLPVLTRFLLNCKGVMDEGGVFSPRVNELLQFLSNTPALQEFYIRGALAPIRPALEPPQPSGDIPHVELPQMRKLSVQTSCQRAVSLLSNINVPRGCPIALSTTSDIDLEFFIPYLTRRLQAIGTLYLRTATQRQEHVASLQMGSVSAGGYFRLDVVPNPLPSVSTDDLGWQIDFFRALLSSSLFASVHTVWPYILSPSHGFDLGEVLSRTLPAVHTLHLSSPQWYSGDSRLGILKPRAPSEGGDGLVYVPFPVLHTFCTTIPSVTYWPEELAMMLRARTDRGHSVARLKVWCVSSGEALHEETRVLRDALHGCGQEVEVFDKEVYHTRYSFARVLPAICTAKEGVHEYWPAWGDESTY